MAFCAIFTLWLPCSSHALSDAETKGICCASQEDALNQLKGALLRNPKDVGALFLAGVELRASFSIKDSMGAFGAALGLAPDTPEGMASACILGTDCSKDASSALYYYNALQSLSELHPDSIPIHWAVAILSRSLTKNMETYNLWYETRNRILLNGVRHYRSVLELMAPSEGPFLVHLTYGNILMDLDAADQALLERNKALSQERTGVILHAAARTHYTLAQYDQAGALIQEALGKEPISFKLHWLAGEILERSGDPKGALLEYDRAAGINKNWEGTLRAGMFLARDLGDLTAARAYAQRQLAAFPNDHLTRVWDARLAAMLGDPQAPQLIQQAGALTFDEKWVAKDDASPDDNDSWWIAVNNGNAPVVRSMLPGSVSKIRTPYAQTALMIAALSGYEQMASDLIKAGAQVDAKDVNQDTALHYAAQFKNPRLVKLLLDAGANPNLKDKFGETPLVKCSYNGNRLGVAYLLEKKADPNMGGSTWGSPLHFAAGHFDINALDQLIAHGADVNSRDRSGATPAMAAMKWYAHSFMIPPLLDAGADINARDKDGRTILHHTINPQLNIPAVDLLLSRGADPTIKDNFGTTSITQARALGFEEIARKLEAKAGKSEQFIFPTFAAPAQNLTTDEVRASYFVFPILMAQGHPLGRISGLPPNDKGAAREELKNMFGIDNAKDLKVELQGMESFQPNMRDEAGDLPLPQGMNYAAFVSRLKTEVEKIHQSVNPKGIDETAWVKTHIMYLADLGVAAGYLKQEESSPLIINASSELAKKYSSWKDFLDSFLLGAKYHNGWETERYENIVRLISQTAPAWM